MDVVYERCCGLDVHKKTVVGCVLMPETKEVRSFSTMTEDLLEMSDWLRKHGCTHVAMESTASFWKPIYNLLEAEDLQVLVVNAKHMKNVPGRKTDVKDAEWIAGLLRHGLLEASYIPDRGQRELRELIRYRRSLIDERAREVNRVQKVLEGANIKLSSVASNTLGKSGRAMLEAMIQGEQNSEALSGLAKGRLKAKKDDLQKALHGLMGDHQRMMLATQLRHIDYLDEEIARLDDEVKKRMLPFEEDLELLDTIPGVGRRTAEQVLAEIGTNMDQFPSAAHLCSWAGLAPGNNESAGKRKSGKTRKGNQKLRATLVEAARAAARTKNTYLSAQYHRIARKGKNRAAVAVAHSILTIVYHMLRRRQPYIELGATYYETRKKDAYVKQTVRKLQSLGFEVVVKPVA
ncbi:competence protein ComEA helix-hairpin-helix repeat-containing protein [Alicyclobacillus hesperidum URH17-3-68]|uniref:IS110 family transposase n=1 Tax=Alicyclobacillus hesperidum TaxID=89784 RepID=UPI000281B865|nr:IS110 family transposase [Alicyclobacillus hesperidum]EJY56432.1 competence protein ComEA helix-hairpin-helix repeat-containing protein [Alicyclobacillus hesperidum URH17-3-68]